MHGTALEWHGVHGVGWCSQYMYTVHGKACNRHVQWILTKRGIGNISRHTRFDSYPIPIRQGRESACMDRTGESSSSRCAADRDSAISIQLDTSSASALMHGFALGLNRRWYLGGNVGTIAPKWSLSRCCGRFSNYKRKARLRQWENSSYLLACRSRGVPGGSVSIVVCQ